MKAVIQSFIDSGRHSTALGEAARWGEPRLLEKLLDDGIAIDAKSENGGTALMMAASGGQVEIVRLLLARGADPNARDDRRGRTALTWCLSGLHSEHVYLSIAQMLLDAGADVDAPAVDGQTALDFARQTGSAKVVDLITNR